MTVDARRSSRRTKKKKKHGNSITRTAEHPYICHPTTTLSRAGACHGAVCAVALSYAHNNAAYARARTCHLGATYPTSRRQRRSRTRDVHDIRFSFSFGLLPRNVVSRGPRRREDRTPKTLLSSGRTRGYEVLPSSGVVPASRSRRFVAEQTIFYGRSVGVTRECRVAEIGSSPIGNDRAGVKTFDSPAV